MGKTRWHRLLCTGIAACLVPLFSGCGTLLSFQGNKDGETLYGGVATDLEALGLARHAVSGEDKPVPDIALLTLVFSPIILLDIPVSAVADTLLLPVQVWKRKQNDRADNFLAALKSGDRPRVEAMLRQRPALAWARVSGEPILSLMIRSDRMDDFAFLLEHGARVNAANYRGQSPLHVAVENQKPEVVETLIKAGADLNAQTTMGITPLHIAVRDQDLTMMETLIKAGADLNVQGAEGGPLHVAAAGGNVDVITLLLDSGARLDRTPQYEPNSLAVAANRGNQAAVNILIKAGANLNPTNGGSPPLHLAVLRGHAEIVAILIQAGADVNQAPTIYKNTPLRLAVDKLDVDVVRQLLDAGADPYLRDDYGRTPIDVARRKLERYDPETAKRKPNQSKADRAREILQLLLSRPASASSSDPSETGAD